MVQMIDSVGKLLLLCLKIVLQAKYSEEYVGSKKFKTDIVIAAVVLFCFLILIVVSIANYFKKKSELPNSLSERHFRYCCINCPITDHRQTFLLYRALILDLDYPEALKVALNEATMYTVYNHIISNSFINYLRNKLNESSFNKVFKILLNFLDPNGRNIFQIIKKNETPLIMDRFLSQFTAEERQEIEISISTAKTLLHLTSNKIKHSIKNQQYQGLEQIIPRDLIDFIKNC
jgi:hypothetical protein